MGATLRLHLHSSPSVSVPHTSDHASVTCGTHSLCLESLSPPVKRVQKWVPYKNVGAAWRSRTQEDDGGVPPETANHVRIQLSATAWQGRFGGWKRVASSKAKQQISLQTKLRDPSSLGELLLCRGRPMNPTRTNAEKIFTPSNHDRTELIGRRARITWVPAVKSLPTCGLTSDRRPNAKPT